MSANLFARIPFKPLLPGARLPDRLVSCIGTTLGIAAAAVGALLMPTLQTAAFLVAPMGASAVLIFAVPASPLARPWPAIGGHLASVALASWSPLSFRTR